MMKVFLDTNILLDYGQTRDNFVYAKTIFELGERGEIELCASYLSFANMGYIFRHYTRVHDLSTTPHQNGRKAFVDGHFGW